MGGLSYFLVKIIRPSREYYTSYGTRTTNPTTRYKDKTNWVAFGTAICVAGIVFMLQPIKRKE
jgi:hypothetical protein